MVDQGLDQGQVHIGTELGCYKCREYYHFMKDFPHI